MDHQEFPDEWTTLASLTGFQPEPDLGARSSQAVLDPPKPVESKVEETEPSSRTQDLLDPEDLETTETSATQRHLWTNPWAKGAFVAALTGFGAGAVGLFLWSVQKAPPSVPQPVSSGATDSADSQPKSDPQKEEIATLKTVNGLGSQAQAIKQNQSAMGGKPLPSRKVASGSPPAGAKAIPVTPAVAAPPTYSPPATYSPPIPDRAAAQTLRGDTTFSRKGLATPPQLDPQIAWQQAKSLGSYGQTSDLVPEDKPDTISSPKVKEVSTNKTVSSSPDLTNLQNQQYSADTNAILSGVPSNFQTIAPGTTAGATLLTPVFWAQDLKPEQQSQRFAIALSEPLLSRNGSIALPAGTRLMAQISSVSDSGMIELSVTDVISPTVAGDRTLPVPPGALLATGDQGSPLVAKQQNASQELRGMELKTAALGALGQVGSLMNRPSAETTSTSPYLSSTNVTNGSTNLIGGVLQGAFGALSQQQQRNQQAMQEIQKRPNLWSIPKGQRLQIIVNQSFGVSL